MYFSYTADKKISDCSLKLLHIAKEGGKLQKN